MNKTFREVKEKGPENLIIDLRYNFGGNVKIPALLYSYITENEFIENVSLTMPDIDIPRTENLIALGEEKIDKIKDVKIFMKMITNGFETVDNELVNN